MAAEEFGNMQITKQVEEEKDMPQSVRWRFGENEIEVVGDEGFIEKHLTRFEAKLGEDLQATKVRQPREASALGNLDENLSPAEFYRKLRPKGGVESLIVVGKYLHDFKKQANFSKADIRAMAGEIRIKEIHPQYYTLALQRGLLRELDGGLVVTLSGDELARKLASANVTE
jgi:hypothetical protein